MKKFIDYTVAFNAANELKADCMRPDYVATGEVTSFLPVRVEGTGKKDLPLEIKLTTELNPGESGKVSSVYSRNEHKTYVHVSCVEGIPTELITTLVAVLVYAYENDIDVDSDEADEAEFEIHKQYGTVEVAYAVLVEAYKHFSATGIDPALLGKMAKTMKLYQDYLAK